MFKLIFNIPSKLQRKVLIEKIGPNNYVIIPTTKSVKIMKLKRSFSIFLCIICSIFLAYINACLMSFKSDLRQWEIGERMGFLACLLVGSFAIGYYCRNHFVVGEHGRQEEMTISYLSANWFKKLLSVFIIYFVVLFLFASVISFCTMSIDASKMEHVDRVIAVVFASLATIALCGLIHHNTIKLFKVEI